MNRQFKNEIRNKTSRQLDAKIRQNVQTKDARKLKFGISPSYLNNNQHYSCIQFIRYLKVKTRVHPKNKSYYTDFLEKIYKIDYSLGNGHFYSVFNPRNKKLEIILPISFPSKIDWEKGGIPNQYKDASRELKNEEQKLFMRDIKNTWSKDKAIDITIENTPWRKLKSINIDVNVKIDNTKPFFKIGGNDNNIDWVFNAYGGHAVLSSQGYNETKYFKNTWLYRLYYAKTLRQYNVFAHEAGHMFGLDDEYQIGNGDYKVSTKNGIDAFDGENMRHYSSNSQFKHRGIWYKIDKNGTVKKWSWFLPIWTKTDALPGTKTGHYDLVKRVFGESIANTKAIMDDQRNNRSSTIMGDGYKVKRHHYVTFWDAMIKSIQKEYGDQISQIAPNQDEDWQINKISEE